MTILLARTPRPSRCGGGRGVGRGVVKDESDCMLWILWARAALCPHLKGVVCWNTTEKSWDCPVHGSRFSKDGVQLCGPSKMGLEPADDSGKMMQEKALKV